MSDDQFTWEPAPLAGVARTRQLAFARALGAVLRRAEDQRMSDRDLVYSSPDGAVQLFRDPATRTYRLFSGGESADVDTADLREVVRACEQALERHEPWPERA